MITENYILDKLVNQTPSFTSDFFRFCVTDQLPLSLSSVLDGTVTPLQYAKQLEASSYKKITNRFAVTTFDNCPKIIKRAWVYDKLIAAALFYRVATLFPADPVKAKDIFAASSVYIANLESDGVALSQFGGLTHFASNARMFCQLNPQDYDIPDGVYFNRLVDQVGDIDDPNWIFWDNKWQGLWDRPHRLIIFKRFIHAAFSMYMMLNFSSCYNMSEDDMLGLMAEFVDLRLSTKTKYSDVDAFIRRLVFYFDLRQHHSGFEMLLDSPFSLVGVYYLECNGNQNVFQQKMMEQYAGSA